LDEVDENNGGAIVAEALAKLYECNGECDPGNLSRDAAKLREILAGD
jgi:hypothetical protein